MGSYPKVQFPVELLNFDYVASLLVSNNGCIG